MSPLTIFAASQQCKGESFLGLPHWYKYLDTQGSAADCSVIIAGLPDLWLILMAVIEILLRVATFIAVIYVLLGGIKFITSRGNSDKVNTARKTVEDGLIGMVITIVATAVVSYIAGRLS